MSKSLDEGINEFVKCLWNNGIDIGHRPVWTEERRNAWDSIFKPLDKTAKEREEIAKLRREVDERNARWDREFENRAWNNNSSV